MLIEKGADINYHIDSFDDPIIIAIDDDNYQIVNLLLVNGAVTNALSEFGEPVLMCAAIRNNLQICKLLLEYGADINAENKKGLSVLDVASITIGYETQKTTDKFSSGKKLQASDELLNFLISKGAKHTKKYFKDYGYLDGK